MGFQAGRGPLAAGGPLARAQADLRDPPHPLAAGQGRRRHLRWRGGGAPPVPPGRGGAPAMFLRDAGRALVGVEAVIDKDLASQLLAREVGADLLVMATDVDGVYTGWGTPAQRRAERGTTSA